MEWGAEVCITHNFFFLFSSSWSNSFDMHLACSGGGRVHLIPLATPLALLYIGYCLLFVPVCVLSYVLQLCISACCSCQHNYQREINNHAFHWTSFRVLQWLEYWSTPIYFHLKLPPLTNTTHWQFELLLLWVLKCSRESPVVNKRPLTLTCHREARHKYNSVQIKRRL